MTFRIVMEESAGEYRCFRSSSTFESEARLADRKGYTSSKHLIVFPVLEKKYFKSLIRCFDMKPILRIQTLVLISDVSE